MNTQHRYVRRPEHTTAEAGRALAIAWNRLSPASRDRVPGEPVPALAPSDRRSSTVAWVRLSELHSALGTRLAGRGIDLQSELVRRTRHVPRSVASRALTAKHKVADNPNTYRPPNATDGGRSL